MGYFFVVGSRIGLCHMLPNESASSLPNSNQSFPNNSTGCCARSEPLPQFIESAEQCLWQPQQIRSGCAGCIGNFLIIASAKYGLYK
jgi:hypothetical protein